MPRAVRKPSSLLLGAAAALALAIASLTLESGVTYDPYAWLIWGRELAHFTLVTTGVGTSWKPLPSLIAAVFAPLGHAQAEAWLVVARAGGLFAAFMAFRLGARIGRPGPAWLAGTVAAASFLFAHEVVRRTAVGNVEALATACGLLAIERHLDDRRGQAFALVVAVGLIRPEAWPFVLAYAGWLWFARSRPPRWTVAALGALVPLLWFGGDLIGSGTIATGSDRALRPLPGTPAISSHPALAVLQEAWRMLSVPTRGALLAAIAWAIFATLRTRARGARTMVVLAGLALAWTAIVAAMAQRGYPGLPRFLFPAIGLAAVVT